MSYRFTTLNTSILLGDMALADQLQAAADHGFAEVELWWPFANAAPSLRHQDQVLKELAVAGMSLVSLNLYEGGMARGERGLVCRADSQRELDDSLPVARRLLAETGCSLLNVLHGNHSTDEAESVQRERAARRTAEIAEDVAPLGATVLIEQLSNVPAYGLRTVHELLAGVEAARHYVTDGKVMIQFDAFHLARAGADLLDLLESHILDIGHIQLADLPDRGGPGTGDLDWEELLGTIDRLDYGGRVALEYSHYVSHPFEWMRPWQGER
ncbi:TIM barrel protein [Demequina sp. SO4-13]|uniref:TIM barrel protein n=1 Tax=Demequina sp. SO4-13 TaxID=3401027 RepID=UPI003AF9C6DE